MVPKFIPTPSASCRRLRLYAYGHRSDDLVTGDVQVLCGVLSSWPQLDRYFPVLEK